MLNPRYHSRDPTLCDRSVYYIGLHCSVSAGTVARVVFAPDKLCPRRMLHVPDETITSDKLSRYQTVRR